MLSRISMSFLLVSNYFPSSSCVVGVSSRISTCLQIPEWLTWTGQDFCSLYLFPPFLSFFSVVVIFIPLSSGSKYRSGSRAISISRVPRQQNGKGNMEIQSPCRAPSWWLTDTGLRTMLCDTPMNNRIVKNTAFLHNYCLYSVHVTGS